MLGFGDASQDVHAIDLLAVLVVFVGVIGEVLNERVTELREGALYLIHADFIVAIC